MIVVLMGYMGSGKSTIGRQLATLLNYDFLDLDTFISEQENTSISKLFQTKGEIYFRKKEALFLREILNSNSHLILALGGGTPCYGNNLQYLINHSKVQLFYLKLSIPQLAERLFKEKDKRPLISHLKTKEALTEFIGKHLFERSPYYNEAKYIINSDFKSQDEILKQIHHFLI